MLAATTWSEIEAQWWKAMGRKAYPNATRLTITADSGGSNSSRSRLWKLELQDFADMGGIGDDRSSFTSQCSFSYYWGSPKPQQLREAA